jgi:hypothetical protein
VCGVRCADHWLEPVWAAQVISCPAHAPSSWTPGRVTPTFHTTSADPPPHSHTHSCSAHSHKCSTTLPLHDTVGGSQTTPPLQYKAVKHVYNSCSAHCRTTALRSSDRCFTRQPSCYAHYSTTAPNDTIAPVNDTAATAQWGSCSADCSCRSECLRYTSPASLHCLVYCIVHCILHTCTTFQVTGVHCSTPSPRGWGGGG